MNLEAYGTKGDLIRAGRSGDRIPVVARFSRPRPYRPWGPFILLYNDYLVSFPGVKRPGRGSNHPPPSSAEVKQRVELYLYSPSGSSWPVLGQTLPLPFTFYGNKWKLTILISRITQLSPWQGWRRTLQNSQSSESVFVSELSPTKTQLNAG